MKVIDRLYETAKEALIPLSVHVDLTYRCHQRCIHCYLPEAWRRGEGPGPELTTAQVKNLLDQLAAAGTLFLTISGGEIFLRPDCFSILEYARALNFSMALFTSGTLGLNKEQIRNLAELGVEGLFLSLHHFEAQVHDEITGVPGSWQRLWKTIESCQTYGLNIIFNCTPLSNNFRGVPELKKFADQKNIIFRMDVNLTPRWDGSPHATAIIMSAEDKHWLFQELGEPEPEEGWGDPLTVTGDFQDKSCDIGFNRCYITPQGDLWPCMDLPWPCGSIIEDDFSTLWNKSRTMNVVRRIQRELKPLQAPLCAYATQERSFSREQQQAFKTIMRYCCKTWGDFTATLN